MLEIIEKQNTDLLIKVVGVGGAGGNALNHMIREGVQGVEFIAVDTDAQALNLCQAASKLLLGKPVAEAERTLIVAQLSGANMVFIVVGMGSDSGVNAAPAIAEVARELGIFTIGVVSSPFSFEGRRRRKNAEADISAFVHYVDSLIVIPNDKLMEMAGEDDGVAEYFELADKAFRNAVGGIAEILSTYGLVGIDLEDVRDVIMSESGYAMLGYGVASGKDRAQVAARQAIASPLLAGVNLASAKGVLTNITATRHTLKMKEIGKVMNIVAECTAKDARIVFGSVYDENMGEQLRVTVVVAGLG
ncbi:MAG: cell division protein FtsZ [Zoogloeaceae bacterium]|jgi:cell division protein FtsZ|nr:cell division protein FtsZ [Zoogloeaceae bacterium]